MKALILSFSLLLSSCAACDALEDEADVIADFPNAREECVGKLPEMGYKACRLFLGDPECEETRLFTDTSVGLNYPCDGETHQTTCDVTGQITCVCTLGLEEQPLWTCGYFKCTFWACVDEAYPDAGPGE